MGHRHIFNTGQIFDPNDEQSWKHLHPEQPYGHFARAVPAENSSLVYPVDNMSIDAIPYGGSHWNSTPISNGFPTSNPCVEMPHHQPDALGLSHDPFMHPSSVGNFSMASESYPHQASSSNYGAQTFNHIEEGLVDLTSNGRGPYKRKSPGVPSVCERGSSSRCYNVATPPDLSMPSDMWQEKQNIDCHQTPWDTSAINSNYIGNNLPVGNEGSLRNVRSRALFEADNTLPRTNLSAAPSHQTYMAPNPGDHSCPMDYMVQNFDAQMRDWGHFHASHSAQGRSPMPDPSAFNHETNNFIIGGNNPGAPLEIGPYHNNFIASRTNVPQNLQGAPGQSVRGSRSGYTQRSTPTFRGPSSSNVHWGHSETTNGGMQIGMESYPSRHSRPLSTIGWRSNDRSGRTRISSDRFRSSSDESGLRSRMASEGLMIVDRSGMYGSRSVFDQHSDMRLDVDNMSYEELLALGERIGNVSTGLSEDLVSKCLTESVYCSSDEIQDEERCVICLDEYKNMDDVGTLRKCGHDFHVSCIKKWLFMKNLCPICKASVAAD